MPEVFVESLGGADPRALCDLIETVCLCRENDDEHLLLPDEWDADAYVYDQEQQRDLQRRCLHEGTSDEKYVAELVMMRLLLLLLLLLVVVVLLLLHLRGCPVVALIVLHAVPKPLRTQHTKT